MVRPSQTILVRSHIGFLSLVQLVTFTWADQVVVDAKKGKSEDCDANKIRAKCFYQLEVDMVTETPRLMSDLMAYCGKHDLKEIDNCYHAERQRCQMYEQTPIHRKLRTFFEEVRKAFQHLCLSRTSRERYCWNFRGDVFHDYTQMCLKGLVDGSKGSVGCSRYEMTIRKSWGCLKYVKKAMGGECYYMDYNFHNTVRWLKNKMRKECYIGDAAGSLRTFPLFSVTLPCLLLLLRS